MNIPYTPPLRVIICFNYNIISHINFIEFVPNFRGQIEIRYSFFINFYGISDTNENAGELPLSPAVSYMTLSLYDFIKLLPDSYD